MNRRQLIKAAALAGAGGLIGASQTTRSDEPTTKIKTTIKSAGNEAECVDFGDGYTVRAIFHDSAKVDGKELVWACVSYMGNYLVDVPDKLGLNNV